MYTRGSQNVGSAPPPPEGGVGNPLGGASYLYEGHLFLTKYGRKINIYFGKHFAWLNNFTYQLVPVLAPNYKQHILSPAKVRKECYSLAEIYVKSVYMNLFERWEREVHKIF
jgi:hypothetical protein